MPPNRLSRETSPYLLQHKDNPVDWFPWGKEALERAKKEEKPIFLSIGYSACHWCHVMERESFEDLETAKLMNERFINIKVDREERPDIDHIYMAAVQMMTQHGGWPLSVFLTPELEPFYGGTYFPPEDRHGMPSFKKILSGVATAWANRKNEILQSAKQLTEAIAEMNAAGKAEGDQPSLSLVDRALEKISQAFDPTYGGLGSAPKFFHSLDLKLCLRHWKRTGDAKSLAIVTRTLSRLSQGGIFDQLGGGFHRYSTDAEWLVPHFEKMLYDNALVTDVYLETFQITGDAELARTARETLNYVIREMTSEDGAFFSTQDADSEGEEGKFYVWSKTEIDAVLDAELSEKFCQVYDVSAAGNWEGKNILNIPRPLDAWVKEWGTEKEWAEDQLALARRKLLAERSKRIAPSRDEKILVSWNGLMIHTMATGYQVLGDSHYLAAAKRAAEFILLAMKNESGKGLLHSYKDRRARFNAYLDDYATFVNSLITLYESEFEVRWLKEAIRLADQILDLFWDEKTGFFYTPRDHEKLIARPRENHDGAMPAATGSALTALARLSRLTEEKRFQKAVSTGLSLQKKQMEMIPMASASSLIALDFLLNEPVEIVFVAPMADEVEPMVQALGRRFLPSKVVTLAGKESEELIPLLKGKVAVKGEPTLYWCENKTCLNPTVGIEKIVETLKPGSLT